MALTSANTLITSICLWHITLGFYLLKNPAKLANQSTVYMLGEAMGLPSVPTFDHPSPALAFLAAVLITTGICDLFSLSMPSDVVLLHHWAIQAPLRLFFSLSFVVYTFFFSSSSPIYAPASPSATSPNPAALGNGDSSAFIKHPQAYAINDNYVPSAWGGDHWKNRVFFSFMFFEMILWLWAWATLRDERREFIIKEEIRKEKLRRDTLGIERGYA